MSLKDVLVALIQDRIDLEADNFIRATDGQHGIQKTMKELMTVQILLTTGQTALLTCSDPELMDPAVSPKDILFDLIVSRLDFDETHPED